MRNSGTQKGSLYHHFPGGKDELVTETVEKMAVFITGKIRGVFENSDRAGDAIAGQLEFMAQRIEASRWLHGSPLAMVAMDAVGTSEMINQACQNAYRTIQALYIEKFVECGIPVERAATLAIFTSSVIDGAVILARTNQSPEPLQIAAEELRILLNNAEFID